MSQRQPPARTRPLREDWTLTVPPSAPSALAGREVPASVPGTVHTDLLAAGLIDEPFFDDNERLLAWIGRHDWEYRTTFDWSAEGHERHDLVFDGLDTVARISLNGHEVARTANQHRSYRVPVGDRLVEGDNHLVVAFSSPVREADRRSLQLGARPHINPHPYNAIRKAAYTYGWDWGPDMPSAGIWRPVWLHSWSTARLATVRPVAAVSGTDGVLRLHVQVERSDGVPPVRVRARVGDVTTEVDLAAGEHDAELCLSVPDVDLWWPRGHGSQRRYPVEVTLHADGRSDVLDRWERQVGFRTVRLDQEDDEYGTSFAVVVNDRPIWVRGANWIPDEVFLPRVDGVRYQQRLDQAVAANLNLLRVWGGGVYEDDDFYEYCDARGLMVWQDFMLACAAYSEDDPLRSEIVAEAREAVTRLAGRPCVVLWNGSNEAVVGYHHWGWKERLDGRTWGAAYYTDLLPAVVAELAPGTPYLPSSPWSGSIDSDPHDHARGPSHLWQPWNRLPYDAYRDDVPRFVAEFGWQGPPTLPTLWRALSDDPLTPESPGMNVHQKAWKGQDKLTDGLVPHFRVPQDFEDWHWAMSLNQANAVRFALEHFRSWSPRCAGAIVWQLNDCWPVTSWAAIDGDGRPKPVYYAISQALADRLLTVQPRGDGLAVVAVNDTSEPWQGAIVVARLTYDGVGLERAEISVDVPARGSATLPIPVDVARAGDAGGELLRVALGEVHAEHFFADYRDSILPPPQLLSSVQEREPGVYTVTITARTLLRDLAILAETVHPDARADRMLVTLLPGESVTFSIAGPSGLDPAAFAVHGALRTANELVHAEWTV